MGVLVERMRYTNHEKLDLDLDEDGDDFDGSGLGLGLEHLIDRNIFDILTIIWDWWWVEASPLHWMILEYQRFRTWKYFKIPF